MYATDKSKEGEMIQFTRESLAENGFQGFISVSQLKSDGCGGVPRQMGVYVVLRETTDTPVFRTASIGGHFKSQDPTVSEQVLIENWVNSATVVYIGKAGGTSSSATLQSRLRQYMSFGCGKPVHHWGGRLIWQLADCDNLLVAWKPLDTQEPRKTEQEMISDFVKMHAARPFANLSS